MAAGGRPTKYDPSYCDRLIDEMAQGYSMTAFAGGIPVARSTINKWASEHPEFSEALKIGAAARTRYLEQTLLTAKDGPTVTSRIFALKNAAPEEWRDKHEVEHTSRTAMDMTDDELARIARSGSKGTAEAANGAAKPDRVH